MLVGLGGGVAIGSLGGIGEHAWQASNPGQIEAGWLTQDSFAALPDVAFPYTSGFLPLPGNVVSTNCINGTCYALTNHYDNVLYSGDYYATSLAGSMIVLGTARLILPHGLNMSGQDAIVINPGGNVTIYAGTNCTIGGNGIINLSGFAKNCEILGTPRVTTFTFNFSGVYTGVIVAPEAAVQMNGSGTNRNEFIGALVANSLKLYGNFNFHFDESLIAAPARLGPPIVVERQSIPLQHHGRNRLQLYHPGFDKSR